MVTWKGAGYTDEFTKVFDVLLGRLKNGALLEIVQGKDDLCRTLDSKTTAKYHCENDSVLLRDEQALQSINRLLGTNWQIGDTINPTAEQLTAMRAGFKSGALRSACQGCEWFSFCSDIADADFSETRWLSE